MANKKIIIAIDGHSSCGKSTMAKSIAQELGYIYIDSGAMYRVVTLYALRRGLINNGVPDREKLIAGTYCTSHNQWVATCAEYAINKT